MGGVVDILSSPNDAAADVGVAASRGAIAATSLPPPVSASETWTSGTSGTSEAVGAEAVGGVSRAGTNVEFFGGFAFEVQFRRRIA